MSRRQAPSLALIGAGRIRPVKERAAGAGAGAIAKASIRARLPEEIVILAHHRTEYRRCAHLRRRRTIALNSLRQLADAACAYGAGGRDWPGWLAEAEAIAARCPTRKTVSRPALEAVVAELERRRRDGEAALRAAFAAGNEDEAPRPRRQRSVPLQQRQPMGPQIDPLSMGSLQESDRGVR